jgi:Tol biopolymer transport system component
VITSSSLFKAKLNEKIVYSTDATGTLGLRTINPDGTGQASLTSAQNYERRPAWSPDGKKVAFQSFTPGNPSVYEISVVNANGSGRLRLSTTAATDARPTWSPNGKRIAFVGTDFSIYTVSPNGGAAIKLINNGLAIHQLDWSPDGTKLAFESNGEIYSVSLAGTQLKLTNHPGQNTDANPRWSPDGSRVLFNRSAAAWVVNSDGLNEHKLLNQGGMTFTWSPDGLRLAFELAGEINVVNLDGTGLLQLTNNNATPGFISYKFEPDWQPIPTFNPADDALFFVRQQYADFLNREPDSSGLTFWYNQIASCGSDQQCIELKRINVSAAFYLSIEFQGTGYLVERLYKAAYGDATGNSTFPSAHTLPVPIVRFSEFLNDTQQIGRGVVVGQTGWEQALENNKQSYSAEFVQRARFTTALPLTMTPAQFVDRVNLNAGNPLSQSERDQMVTDLTNNTKTRSQALRAVAEHPNLVGSESNRAFVLMQYFGYLRRNPNDPQDTDYTGYDFWLTKLNQFNGNFVNADMVKAFINSAEYRRRFGT